MRTIANVILIIVMIFIALVAIGYLYPSISQTQHLSATISYAENPIVRGNYQTIYATVTQNGIAVTNLAVHIHVVYASLATTKDFDVTTSSNGVCQAGWLIGGNSDPGIFSVSVTIQSVTYSSSFQVTTA